FGRRLDHGVGDGRTVEDHVQLKGSLGGAGYLAADVQASHVSRSFHPDTDAAQEGGATDLHRDVTRGFFARLDNHLVARPEQGGYLVLESIRCVFLSAEELAVEPDRHVSLDVGEG